MSNITSYFALNGKLAIQPGSVAGMMSSMGLEPANFYVNPVGPTYGKIGILLTKRNVNEIKASTNLSLDIGYSIKSASGNITVPALTFISANRVSLNSEGATGPNATDGDLANNSIYYCELGDRRYRAVTQSRIEKQYNIFSYAAYDSTIYLTESINDETPWTWSTMIQDLWETAFLGTFPELPFQPKGEPMNFHFVGVSAWDALHEALALWSMSTYYDVATDKLKIVSLGADQSPSPDDYGLLPKFNATPIQDDLWDIPAKVVVTFPVQYLNYGQEDDTSQTGNWLTTKSLFSVENDTGSGAPSITKVNLWGGQSDLLDKDNVSVDEVGAVAQEMTQKWIQNRKTKRRHKVFPGIVAKVVTGSEIRAVTYRFGLSGSETEYVSGSEIAANTDASGDVAWASMSENTAPPNFARFSYPNYPRLPNHIRITGPGDENTQSGDELTPNEAGHYEGVVVRREGNTPTDKHAVFVQPVLDDYNASQKMRLGQSCYGRLAGTQLNGGVNHPVYQAKIGGGSDDVKWGFVTADVHDWGSGGCVTVIVSPTETCDTGGGEELVFVQLPRIEHSLPRLTVGDVIAYTSILSAGDPGFVILSDYTVTDAPSVVAVLSAVLDDWSDTPGCQVVACTVITCGGSAGNVEEAINVIFPNVPGKIPAIGIGDQITASPTDLTADTPVYVIGSDYSKSAGGEAKWGAVQADVTSWSGSGCTIVVVTEATTCDGTGDTTNVNVYLPEIDDVNPNLHEGDVISYIPISSDSTPLADHVIVSAYTVSTNLGVKPFTLEEDVSGTSVLATLDCPTPETGVTIHDPQSNYQYGCDGDSGYVAWIDCNSRWEIIDFRCDDGIACT